MLTTLQVNEFAVIEDAELDLVPSLTVLTGETGAGKSVLIGALKLLLGDRASIDQVRSGASRATIRGSFTISPGHPSRALLDDRGIPLDDDNLIIRREVTSEGRSRAWMNDTSVTVGTLREVGQELVDLHGQHEHQSLLRPSSHLLLLDAFAGLDGEREEYIGLLDEYRAVRDRLESIRTRESEIEERRELWRFQLEEIDRVDPLENEEENLERETRILEGAEAIMSGVSSYLASMAEGETPLLDQLQGYRSELDALSGIDPGLRESFELLDEALLSMTESTHTAQRYLDGFEFDEARLTEARDRLAELIQLARKYGGSFEAMLHRRQELREALGEQVRQEEETVALAEREIDLRARVASGAMSLHERRSAATDELQRRVEAELEYLAMPGARFEIAIELTEDQGGAVVLADGSRCEAGRNGIDRVEFRLGTNPGNPVLPLQKVASGGEISRIMLALKSVFGEASHVPTLVFDEIDSGIGGATADRVGDRLEALAAERQLIVITHLPQIARRGGHHLLVEKSVEEEVTRVGIHQLDGEERTRALAVLMSGDAESDAVLDHARELLQETGRVENGS